MIAKDFFKTWAVCLATSLESHLDVTLSLLFLDGGTGKAEKSVGLYKLLLQSVLKSVFPDYYQ